MKIFPKLENWANREECGRRLILEQLEARIVLDGAVTDAQDVHDGTADTGQVDSLGWVYVDNGWWQEDNGSGWWWEEATGWFWNELTGWWVLNSGDFSYWYHGEHQFWAQEISTDAWFWWDDITDQIWEPAFTWFADQVNSEWMWVYNDWNGSHFYADDLQYFYQDHNDSAWSWFDAVNDAAWKPAFTWYVDGSGVQVFNDWHSSEYIWGNDFHYIQQHTSSYVNDAPLISVTGTQTVDEDTNLTIPSIYVFDVDSGNSLLEVTLSVQHGTLTLSTITDLVFISGGGTADALMVFQGTSSQINAALHDIVYRPDSNFYSSDALAIVVNDLGNSGSGGAQSVSESIPITVNAVNDAPWSDQIPNPSPVDEDFGIFEYNISSYFHDIDSVLSYSLGSVTYYDGLTLGNLVVDPSTGTVTFTNTPNSNGWAEIQIIGSDGQYTTSQTFTFTVNPVNDAPVAVDNSVTTQEDTSHIFITAEFGFSDVDARDQLQAVQITSLPTAGHLLLNGSDVALNQIISIADINAGNLTFMPDTGANGADYAHFQFKVSDGTVFSTAAYLMTINVSSVNNVPTGADNTIVMQEDTSHAFMAGEFGFSDVDTGDQLQAVRITSLPTAGHLLLNGTDVILNQIISIADINAGNLTFSPAPDANGTGYASFQFKVSDGIVFSNSAYAMTLNVTPVNDAPTGADNTVSMLEDTSHAFTAAEFGFSDVDTGDQLQAVQITSLPTVGNLKLNGINVTLNQIVSIADINAGNLTFSPAPDANSTGYASFQFKVSDGTAFSNSAYGMNLNVTPVNDAPTGADNTVSMLEDTSHAFTAAEFGFSDVDTGDQLQAVQITSLPTAGNLKLNGINVTLNQIVSIADINAGNLTFSPAPDANGTGYASFQFKVSDGTAFSTAAYIMTVDVDSSNHAPTGADNTVSMLEDTSHVFVATEFGFSDIDTGDQLQAVQITSLPTAGNLKLNGTNVTLNQIVTIADINAGHLTFSPVPDANGTGYTSFQFKVSDGTAFSNSAYAMTLDVTPVNDTPTATFQTITLTENAVTQVSLVADDGDPEVTQTLTYFLETVPANGALYLTQLDAQNGTNPLAAGASFTGGTLWYRSTLNNDADTSFMFHVRDDGGTANGANDTSASAVAAVTVTSDNQAPDAGNFGVSVNEDSVVTITGWNFTDAEGNQAQAIRITDLPDHGTLFIDANDNNQVDPGEAIALQSWQGGVTFTFDDGYLNNYQYAFPVLEQYGVEGVSLVVTGNVQQGLSDTMSWAQLLEMQAAGWEIGSHSMTHADLTTLTDSELIYELSESRNLLVEHGLTGTTFAYPYGAFDQRVAEFVAQYYEGCREAWGNDGITEIPGNPYKIYNRQVTHTTTPQEVIQWIDDAVANNQWLVLSFHGIVTGEASVYQYNVNDLETIVSYVSSHNIATPTISEALNNELSPISWADATTKLKYIGDQNYSGYDSFKYVVIDSAGSEGEMPDDAGTVIVTVHAVNDAPVNSLPVAQTTDVNTALTFSTVNNNAISISDVDARTDAIEVQLTVTEGTLTLGGTTGLSFTAGDGTADSTMTFTGKIASVNEAFQGMSYTPTTDYSGDAVFRIVTNDLGNNPSGEQLDTDELGITVRR
ncbi:tandem-95 repeat protein [Desulfomonile tiedjei]|uniref:Putative xylanase/chitin deacetylase n=1 Tax=Desulfomonile tiedjei (strain ATCC 49306 / DSM 6799 / DCB-1) TaxID=706587 RepID=I4C4R6_DESTA|nr:Ig-like domain-containing protein [Desulfomonile tiedjei]AFM24557.1 putative xylanase/chitin deacetylase [Desulfomonile tiedjei DSM 6799]